MIPTDDMIGTRWGAGGRWPGEALDCYGAVLEVYRRAGRTIPDVQVAPEDWGERVPEIALREFRARWEPATPPLRKLDVLVCRPLGDEAAGHLAVVVDDAGQWAFHVAENRSGAELVRVRALRRNTEYVARYRGSR